MTHSPQYEAALANTPAPWLPQNYLVTMSPHYSDFLETTAAPLPLATSQTTQTPWLPRSEGWTTSPMKKDEENLT